MNKINELMKNLKISELPIPDKYKSMFGSFEKMIEKGAEKAKQTIKETASKAETEIKTEKVATLNKLTDKQPEAVITYGGKKSKTNTKKVHRRKSYKIKAHRRKRNITKRRTAHQSKKLKRTFRKK